MTTPLGTLAAVTIGAGAILGGAALTLTTPADARGPDRVAWLGAVLIGIGASIFAAGLFGGAA